MKIYFQEINTSMRCESCKRKAGLMIFNCDCGMKLCINCQDRDRHGCCTDVAAKHRELLKRRNKTVVGDKLERLEKKIKLSQN